MSNANRRDLWSRWTMSITDIGVRSSGSRHLVERDSGKRLALSIGDALDREILHRLLEQAMEIQFRTQVEEHAAKPNGGAIHQHELARHRHRSLLAQRFLHLERLPAAVFA